MVLPKFPLSKPPHNSLTPGYSHTSSSAKHCGESQVTMQLNTIFTCISILIAIGVVEGTQHPYKPQGCNMDATRMMDSTLVAGIVKAACKPDQKLLVDDVSSNGTPLFVYCLLKWHLDPILCFPDFARICQQAGPRHAGQPIHSRSDRVQTYDV